MLSIHPVPLEADMSRYPDHQKKIMIHFDMLGPATPTTVDVPDAWPDMDDDARRAWAVGMCAAALAGLVAVTWSDPAEALGPYDWPTSWDGRTGEPVE
jgi:hypothetical protein